MNKKSLKNRNLGMEKKRKMIKNLTRDGKIQTK